MEGLWFKEVREGRHFILRLEPGGRLGDRLRAFAREAGVRYAVVVSAVGSVKDVTLRGIKCGAKLPITLPRLKVHHLEGPLELLTLEGNLFPDEAGELDCHLHITASRSSGAVVGGHLEDAEVFATCELVLHELAVEGVERHLSRSGGVATLFEEEPA